MRGQVRCDSNARADRGLGLGDQLPQAGVELGDGLSMRARDLGGR